MSNVNIHKFPYIAFTLFLILEVSIFLSEKMTSINVSGDEFYFGLLSQPWLLVALFLSAMQFYFWTSILAKADLAVAYSMSSLSYPITMVAARFIFHENLSISVWAGGGLITMGVIIIGLEEKPGMYESDSETTYQQK
jgi:hypothetical protein